MYVYLLYIEIPGSVKSLIFVILLLVVGFIKVYIDSVNKRSVYSDPYSAFSLPLYLIRAHTARFTLMNFKSFESIKLIYRDFLKKYNAVQAGDEQYELNQLNYLIENKIDVKRSIDRGLKEAHKNRLLILIFLFNLAVKDGKISEHDKVYLDNVYKELGIAYDVYQSIRNKYIRDEYTKESGYYDSNYEIKEAIRTLELDGNPDLKDVKTAYRKLAKKYHPDKVRHLGKEHQKGAEEKFKRIQKAYEAIQAERGL